jgi:hypothetical protein
MKVAETEFKIFGVPVAASEVEFTITKDSERSATVKLEKKTISVA